MGDYLCKRDIVRCKANAHCPFKQWASPRCWSIRVIRLLLLRDSHVVCTVCSQVTDDVNSKRTQFFHIDMPSVVNKIQAMDESRATSLVGSFAQVRFRKGVLAAATVHCWNYYLLQYEDAIELW